MPEFIAFSLTAGLSRLCRSTLALVLMLLVSMPLHAEEPACEIVIGSCHRAPLSAEGNGIIDKLVVEAFQRIGKRACVSALPCERSLMNADSGIIDGDILRIPEVIATRYPHLVGVAEPLYSFPMSCFALRKDVRVRSLGDLLPLRVGHILGWKILEDQVKATQVLRVRGPEELFPLLNEDRADVVIYERLTGLKAADELGMKQIRVLDPPLIVVPQYLVLHQQHRALIEPLATALRAMKADGSYARAFRNAGVDPPASK